MAEPSPRRPRRVAAALVGLGLGLALAPAAFGMFSRAPAGGQMLDDFRPYMNAATLDEFRAHIDRIDRSQTELATLGPAATGAGPAADLAGSWPVIEQEMTSMLATIRSNLGRFQGLTALPPFWAFPWFFVIPGAVLAGLGGALWRAQEGRTRVARLAVTGLAIGLVAAPFAFQMFSRAPGGAAMIDDFRPLMATARITDVQGHFLTIAAGEAALRNRVLPALESPSVSAPATAAFVEAWPRMAGDMAPMIGAMADNLDNFAGVDALPPFWLFPWFFVLPGVIAAGLALALRSTERQLA